MILQAPRLTVKDKHRHKVMLKISTFSFAQLKNAEHISLFTNVKNAIDKSTPTKLGLSEAQYGAYVNAVAAEQDIVNRSMSSVYTPEMKALDEDRDRLFKLIRLKLQSVIYASAKSPLKAYAPTIEKNLLSKYTNEITAYAYQEESAVLNGFVLDVHTFLTEDVIEAIGIDADLAELECANKGFADMYHERVVEKAGTDPEMAKQMRQATEEQFRLLACHLEYKANCDTTLVGAASVAVIGIISQLVADAQLRLDIRLGRKADPEVDTPVTDGSGSNVDVPVFPKD